MKQGDRITHAGSTYVVVSVERNYADNHVVRMLTGEVVGSGPVSITIKAAAVGSIEQMRENLDRLLHGSS